MFSWKGSLEKRKEKEQQDQLELQRIVDSFKEEYPKWYKECEDDVESFLKDCGFTNYQDWYMKQDKEVNILPIYIDEVQLSFMLGKARCTIGVNSGVVTEKAK